MEIIDKILKFLSQSVKATGKYFLTKFLTSLIIGVISWLVFVLLDIKLPIIMGTILGITNMIPIFGPWIGLIICALISVFQQPLFALYTALTALALQMLEQFLLIPLLAGKTLELKPVIIMIAVIAGSFLFGVWGVILAVPAAAAVKIGYKIFFDKNVPSNEGDDNKSASL